MADPKNPEKTNADTVTDDMPIADLNGEQQAIGSDTSTKTPDAAEIDDDLGLANEAVDCFADGNEVLNRIKGAKPDDKATDLEIIDFGCKKQTEDHTLEIAVGATALAAAAFLLFGKAKPTESERADKLKAALSPDASAKEISALTDFIREAVIKGDTRSLQEFVQSARDTGRFHGQSPQIKAIARTLSEIGIVATWTDETGVFGSGKPKQSVLSLKVEGSNKEVRIRSDLGIVGLDRDRDSMEVGDKKIMEEISKAGSAQLETERASQKKPPAVGDQVFVGDKWGILQGRTSDGKFIVEIPGRHEYSTAVQGHAPEWYEKNGYEKLDLNIHDANGKVVAKKQVFHYKAAADSDGGSIFDEPSLLILEEGYERQAEGLVVVDQEQVKSLKDGAPDGERGRRVEREPVKFRGPTASLDLKSTDVTYRTYADGVAIGTLAPDVQSKRLNGARDVRIYSPDGGQTKIPLYRSNTWFHFAEHQSGSMGDSKFHITSTNCQDAAAIDRIVMPLLAEALGDNPGSPEAKQLSSLVVHAKLKDPMNRDPRFLDESVDRELKDITVDQKTGRENYRELHVGARGQNAKQYTVYTRTAEDARKAAEIVDRYMAEHAKQTPSLVLAPDTRTGGNSDGRRLPGTNRVSLARETWPFTTIPDYNFENAVDVQEKFKTFGAAKESRREAVGASVEAELGKAIRDYAKKNYGVEGALTQEHLDRIAVDAGAKKGFLTFDTKGQLAVFGSSWETGRGEQGDLTYMADGDSDKMLSEQKARQLIGRQGLYALYELVNKEGPTGSTDPLYFVEARERAANRDFLETHHPFLKTPEDNAQLKALKEALLARDLEAFQRELSKIVQHPDRIRGNNILDSFLKDIERTGLDITLNRPYGAKDTQLEIRFEGSSHKVLISSDQQKPAVLKTRDAEFKPIEIEGEAVKEHFTSLSEAVKYGVKYKWKLPEPVSSESGASGRGDGERDAVNERIAKAPKEIKPGLEKLRELGNPGWEKMAGDILDLELRKRLTSRVSAYLSESGAARLNEPQRVETLRLFVKDAMEKAGAAPSSHLQAGFSTTANGTSAERQTPQFVETSERHNSLGIEATGTSPQVHELLVRVSYTGSDQVTYSKMVPLLELPSDELRKRFETLTQAGISEKLKDSERDLSKLEGEKFADERKKLEAKIESLKRLQELHEGFETARRQGKESEYVREMQAQLKTNPGGGARGAVLSALSRAGVASALMLLFNDLMPEFRPAPSPSGQRVNPGSKD